MKYLKLLRINNWIKNFFVFIPLFFAGQLTNYTAVRQTVIGFLLFSLTSSIVYILNDYVDRAEDRLHPKKKNRPLANGSISPSTAIAIAIGIAIIIFATLAHIQIQRVSIILGVYFIINILYSFWLKHIAIIDVIIIALGFLLRVLLGGEIASIPVTIWTQFLCFTLALLFAFGKRRGELVNADIKGITRKSLDGYNLQLVDVALIITATITLMCYIMFTFSPEAQAKFHPYVVYTSVFVFIAIMRYFQQAYVSNNVESPIKLAYTDRFLQFIILLWVISFVLLIYFKS